MKKINLKKSVNYDKYVLNLYPNFKTETIFRMTIPSGLVKVSRTEGGCIKIFSLNVDIIGLIDKYCEKGHVSYFDNTAYLFDKDCLFNIEEVGDCVKTGMIVITITEKVYKNMSAKLYVDAEKDMPFWNGYTKENVDGIDVPCFSENK